MYISPETLSSLICLVLLLGLIAWKSPEELKPTIQVILGFAGLGLFGLGIAWLLTEVGGGIIGKVLFGGLFAFGIVYSIYAWVAEKIDEWRNPWTEADQIAADNAWHEKYNSQKDDE